jgi:oligopeptide transport system ATP-binding protein
MTEKPLLDVRDLRTWFELKGGIVPTVRGHVRAVDGVSFELRSGEVLGIAGESGSGKSTIGRSILRLVQPTSGEVLFEGDDVLRMDRGALLNFRRKAQMVFQDPFGSLDPLMTIEEIVTEPLVVQGMLRSPNERRAKSTELLTMVSLDPGYVSRRPRELSGGQRQRVGIARALSVRPKLLIADEPVSALDVSIQAQIINLLEDIKDQLHLAMLFISHDIAVMEHLSDRIAVVYLGRVVEIGPTSTLIRAPSHPYTEALLSAVPEPGPRRRKRIVLAGDMPNPSNPPNGCVFRTRCRYALAQCADKRPPMRQVRPGHFTACIREDLSLAGSLPNGGAVEAFPVQQLHNRLKGGRP